MTEYRTKFPQHLVHPQIVLCLDDQANIHPSWLLDYFQNAVIGGKRFAPNETVQVGWMIIMLKQTESNELEVWEPQFDSIPIKWTKGVNNTIRHLILQKTLADLLRVEPQFPSLRQAGKSTESFLRRSKTSEFKMMRDMPDGNYSGWQFADSSSQEDQNFYSLFELSFHEMSIIPFLALPPGTTVQKRDQRLIVESAGNKLDSNQNTFLQELVRNSIHV
jgi:hypothetical protein